MSDKRFVDTNILVYAHDTSTGVKHAAAKSLVEELWHSGSGVISTQILQELAVNLRRKVARPRDVKTIRETLADYMGWEVVVNTADSVLEALEIEDRYGVTFWDALVIHAAESSGASVLYSEDLSHGQVFGTVLVVNPFLSSSPAL